MTHINTYAKDTPTETVNGERLSKLGFGVSGPLAAPWFSDDAVRHLLDMAINGGVRHFDTASFYGDGLGEKRLGSALADYCNETFAISTKTGTRYLSNGKAVKDFSKAAIRADVETSLERLNLSCVDIIYLHGPDRANTIEGLGHLRDLKSEGLCRRIGVCGEGALLDDAIEAGAEALMARFNFLTHIHHDLFTQAHESGVHITAIAPLAQALYVGDFWRIKGLADLWRIARALLKNRTYFAASRRIRHHLKQEPPTILEDRSLLQSALAYVLATPFTDIACMTTSNQAHLVSLLKAAKSPLSDAQRGYLNELRGVAGLV